MATCTRDHSRNRSFRVKLGGKLEDPEDILEGMYIVDDGIPATTTVHFLANKLDISIPINDSLYQVIHGGSSPFEEVEILMSRGFNLRDGKLLHRPFTVINAT